MLQFLSHPFIIKIMNLPFEILCWLMEISIHLLHYWWSIVLIHVKLLYNYDIVSVHFNHLPCMKNCDTLSRHLWMLTYTYTVGEDGLKSSMPQQRFKLLIFLKYAVIPENIKGWPEDCIVN